MIDLRDAARQALEVLESGLLVSHHAQVLINLRAALAQQEQKPFGYIWPTGRHPEFRYTQLFTAPPRREWQSLSEEEIHDCFQQRHKDKATERRMIALAIEQALRSKNK
jgi:hypothetical protein